MVRASATLCMHTTPLAAPQVLDNGGMGPLVRLLQHSEEDVQANGAGAIQSICFQVLCLHLLFAECGFTDAQLP